MIDGNLILARSRSPRFRQFEARRVRDLIAEGLSEKAAREFARKEIKGRARASLAFSVEQALQANLEVFETPIGQAKFRLVYPPRH